MVLRSHITDELTAGSRKWDAEPADIPPSLPCRGGGRGERRLGRLEGPLKRLAGEIKQTFIVLRRSVLWSPHCNAR